MVLKINTIVLNMILIFFLPSKFAWSTPWKNCIWIIFDQIHQIQWSNTNTNTGLFKKSNTKADTLNSNTNTSLNPSPMTSKKTRPEGNLLVFVRLFQRKRCHGIVGIDMMLDILYLKYKAKMGNAESKQQWAEDGSSGNPACDFGWTGRTIH